MTLYVMGKLLLMTGRNNNGGIKTKDYEIITKTSHLAGLANLTQNVTNTQIARLCAWKKTSAPRTGNHIVFHQQRRQMHTLYVEVWSMEQHSGNTNVYTSRVSQTLGNATAAAAVN